MKSDPGNADAFNLLGYALRKQAKPDMAGAFKAYEAALSIDPKHQGAHEYIGEAYLLVGKPKEARKHLDALEKICGRKCEAYEDLAKAIAKSAGSKQAAQK